MAGSGGPPAPAWRDTLQLEALDLRLAIMAAVLLVMGLAFHSLTGQFLTPENLYNIAQQTAVVGIVATAMALVIVARQIDLSVGSALGLVGVLIAYLMYTKGWHWLPASAAGLAVALVVAVYQGWLVAGLGVASFVVTLGGLMSLRGAAFLVASGRTQPVTDPFFLLLGGGLDGAIGPLASSLLAAGVCVWLVLRVWQRRRQQRAHGLVPRALWVDLLVLGLLCGAVLGFAAAMNGYRIGDKPEGQGIPVPVLIWGGVVGVISFLVNRTRFGRYVYAIGGNPEAAMLAGIPVRRVMLRLFMLLAVTVTVAAIVAVARLNAGTNSLGMNQELYVIAAAVIGGVALSGGSGTVIGTVLGALMIQFLESGLLLLDVDIGWRMVIVGQVLIAAVVFDVLFRRATGERVS